MFNKEDILNILKAEDCYIDNFILDAFIKNWQIEAIYEDEEGIEYFDDDILEKIRDGLHGKSHKLDKEAYKQNIKDEINQELHKELNNLVQEEFSQEPIETIASEVLHEKPSLNKEVDELLQFKPNEKYDNEKYDNENAIDDNNDVISELINANREIENESISIFNQSENIIEKDIISETKNENKIITDVNQIEEIETTEEDDDFDEVFEQINKKYDENVEISEKTVTAQISDLEKEIVEEIENPISEKKESKISAMKKITEKMNEMTTPISQTGNDIKEEIIVANQALAENFIEKNQPIKSLTLDISNQTLSVLAGALAQKITSEVANYLKHADFIEKAIDMGELKKDNKVLFEKINEIILDNKALLQKIQELNEENNRYVKVVGNIYVKKDQ